MIVGIFLRYIKTYRGYNYIPLACDDRFCGLVGNNGIGKSSILEAIDALFNNKHLNLNIATKRSGLVETSPHVVPVFLIKRSELSGISADLADALNSVAMQILETDVVAHVLKSQLKKFIMHRELLSDSFSMDEYYLVPIGIDRNHEVSLSLFNCRRLVDTCYGEDYDHSVNHLSDAEVKEFTPLLEYIKSSTDFIYIPKEIDSESFTKLETKEIQSLMGESLSQIIEGLVSAEVVKDINTRLNSFLDVLSDELVNYSYRTRTDRQQNLRKQDVYNLVVQAFFNIRKLHRKQGEAWLEINSLSSGEKQKAIIDVAYSLIKNHRGTGDNLILAVDEPESSLHMSACFDQFSALYEISRSCRQLFFATHWYGFFPTIESGSAAVITRKDDEHIVDLINLSNQREQVRQMTKGSQGKLPYDVRLKSINDFVQSIITSSIGEEPYNWLICEGSSEKIYLSAYLKDLVDVHRLRIVPVGGAKEIKRLYQHLSVSYEEFKDEVTGKIYLLSDTDAELVNYDVKNFDNLSCKRMVNVKAKKLVSLVNIQSNPMSPKTEIEDALDGKIFYETLREFIPGNESLKFLDGYPQADVSPAFFALDLRESERDAIEKFFDEGNNKFLFAQEYVKKINAETPVPKWIEEIRDWITSSAKGKK
ncbi:AAA family ATPase [Comamonas thiooxydans]|uniref:AAA family ATPase n=1 Tax=Comamonas thiooxydans TaxID=363952 RepID=UPI00050F3153|nr:AAA family ATPase [Comamonas thiooxydans]KGG82467.1 hypothetical protein P609_19835 [Comamonas thiooxydans]